MDLKQIESFVRVAEMGSFTRAAAVLGIAQPLLSRNVRQLEVELRQTFLLRNGRGVTLTEAGRVLFKARIRSLRTPSCDPNWSANYAHHLIATTDDRNPSCRDGNHSASGAGSGAKSTNVKIKHDQLYVDKQYLIGVASSISMKSTYYKYAL